MAGASQGSGASGALFNEEWGTQFSGFGARALSDKCPPPPIVPPSPEQP